MVACTARNPATVLGSPVGSQVRAHFRLRQQQVRGGETLPLHYISCESCSYFVALPLYVLTNTTPAASAPIKRRASFFELVKSGIRGSSSSPRSRRGSDAKPVTLMLTFLRTKSMARAEVEKMVADVEEEMLLHTTALQTMHHAVVRVQGIVRARTATRVRRNAMRRLEAALTIQCTMRTHLAQRMLRSMFKTGEHHARVEMASKLATRLAATLAKRHVGGSSNHEAPISHTPHERARQAERLRRIHETRNRIRAESALRNGSALPPRQSRAALPAGLRPRTSVTPLGTPPRRASIEVAARLQHGASPEQGRDDAPATNTAAPPRGAQIENSAVTGAKPRRRSILSSMPDADEESARSVPYPPSVARAARLATDHGGSAERGDPLVGSTALSASSSASSLVEPHDDAPTLSQGSQSDDSQSQNIPNLPSRGSPVEEPCHTTKGSAPQAVLSPTASSRVSSVGASADAPLSRAVTDSAALGGTEAVSSKASDMAVSLSLAEAPAQKRTEQLALDARSDAANEVKAGISGPGAHLAPPSASAQPVGALSFSKARREDYGRAPSSKTRYDETSTELFPVLTSKPRVAAVDAPAARTTVLPPSLHSAPAIATQRTHAIRPKQQRTHAIRYAPRPTTRCETFAPRTATGPLQRWCRHCGIHFDLHHFTRPGTAPALTAAEPVAAETRAHMLWTPPARAGGEHAQSPEVVFSVSPQNPLTPPVGLAELGLDYSSLSAPQLRSLLIRCDALRFIIICARSVAPPNRLNVPGSLRSMRVPTLRSSNAHLDAATARARQCEGEAHAMAYAANAAVASAVSSISESVSRLTSRAEADADIARSQLAALHAGLALERTAREAAEARALLVERERAMLFARYAVK